MADEPDGTRPRTSEAPEPEKPKEPLPACRKCGKDQSTVPLLFKDGSFVCGDCSKAEQAALAAAPPPPAVPPPPAQRSPGIELSCRPSTPRDCGSRAPRILSRVCRAA
jgi:hypothetical protein